MNGHRDGERPIYMPLLALRVKCWTCLVALAFFGCSTVLGAPDEKVKYYAQLVQGSDADKPPEAGARPIGPKLSAKLRPIFGWSHYWETSRRDVTVVTGTKKKVSLGQSRAVEIDLTQPGKRRVTALANDKPVCSTSEPKGEVMTIIGADLGRKAAWFVVVRRDKPSVD